MWGVGYEVWRLPGSGQLQINPHQLYPKPGYRPPDTGHRPPATGHRPPATGYRIHIFPRETEF